MAVYGKFLREGRRGAAQCFYANFKLYSSLIAMMKTFDLFKEVMKETEHSSIVFDLHIYK
jgi:hypothetical protein